jgi:rifamycin polyketide synthase modules 1, 2 and 3
MLQTELIQPLPDLLRRQAALYGAKTAFDDGRRAVSYAELDARTGRIAGHLGDLRLYPGDRAAILLGNRVEAVESYFAIARAAAIGMPINPYSSDDELEYLLDDSDARLVITDRAHLARLARIRAGRPATIVLVDGNGRGPSEVTSYEELATCDPATPPRDDLALDDVAWVLYTAGATGRPKGVLSTQRNCLWSVAACYAPVLGLGADDRILWPLPLFHSLAHIVCVLAVTAVGARARIVDGLPAREVLRVWDEEHATVVVGVPTTYHHLVREARAQGFKTQDLRVCLAGGAVTTTALRRAVEETFGAPLVDAYGSTETCGSIAVTWPGDRGADPRSLPVPGLAVRLVDPDSRLDVPDGEEGEVWVRGPNVMVGYHNQPEATAEALDGGWHHTGDLARRDPHGYVALTGRIKDLIIRAGENIHPREIEDVIRSVPGVGDAAVVGRPHEVLGETPVAFVVPAPAGFDPLRVLSVCRERLSAAKVPEDVYEVARIPRAALGKIARRQLLESRTRLRAVGSTHYESLFRIDWVPLPSYRRTATGRWSVIGTGAAGPARALAAAGAPVSVHSTLTDLQEAIAGGAPPPDAALLVPPEPDLVSSGASARRRLLRTTAEYTDHLDAWLADGRVERSLLVVATRGAVTTGTDDPIDAPDQAPLWGLVRSLRAEYPGRLALADLDRDDAAALLPVALAAGEHQVAVRSGVTLLPRLARVAADVLWTAARSPDPQGTAVVTGADTARGATIARHLATGYGIGQLLLVAGPRRGGLAAAWSEPIGPDVNVRIVECDPANRAELGRALSGIDAPVTIVAHAWEPEARPARDAFAAAVASVENLYEFTWHADLTAFLLFSSAAALLETRDAPAYEGSRAAFHDAFASSLRARGVPALSLAWGPWAAETVEDTTALSDRQAVAMLDAALTVDQAQLVATRLNPAALPVGNVSPMLRDLVDTMGVKDVPPRDFGYRSLWS